MAKTMKAAVVTAFDKPLSIEEMPVPEVGANQVLMKVEACGVCFTDVSAARGRWPMKPNPPFIPGHEGVGFAAAVGSQVMGVNEGDRIGVPFMNSTCGHCEYCCSGREPLCHQLEKTGYSVNGGFAEYQLVDADYVARIPDNLEFGPTAPLMCADVTTYKGLKETEAKPGQWVVVSGVGGLGHSAVQLAKAMGMHCAAVDVKPESLALAEQLGADLTVNAIEQDPVAVLQEQVGGAHGVLVTAGSGAAFTQGVGMLHRSGTLSLVGVPKGDVALPGFLTVLTRITVRGSILGTRQDLAECLQFAAEGKVEPHFTWESLDAVNDILTRLEDGKVDGRVVMRIE